MYNYFGFGTILLLIIAWHVIRNVVDKAFNMWKRW